MAGPVVPARPYRLSLRDLLFGRGAVPAPSPPPPPSRPDWSRFRDPATWQQHPLTLAGLAASEVLKHPGTQAFDIFGGGLELPGAIAAMSMARMSPQHFFQMRLTSLLSEGVPEEQAVSQLLAQVPLSEKRITKAVQGARENLARIIKDSGGTATNLQHYIEGITASFHMRHWYEEAVPMVQLEIPRQAGEALVDGMTLRQWRGMKVLAQFGTNTPPKANYEQFKKVVPYINRTNSNQELLEAGTKGGRLFGMKSKTPGMPGLKKTLQAGEGPLGFETGGRKIESYYYDLANKKRDAFGEVMEPVTADRWIFRFANLPFEEGGVYASTSNALASAAYDIIERNITRAAQHLNIAPKQAQAAAWFTEKLRDSFRVSETMEQGYPFMQQKVLNEVLGNVTKSQIRDMAKALYNALYETAGEGGTVATTGKNMFGEARTAVGVYPERSRLFPVAMDFRQTITPKSMEKWTAVTGGLPKAFYERSKAEIRALRTKQLPKLENFVRDNADLFFDANGQPYGELVGAGGWLAPAGAINVAGRPTQAKTLVLDPTLLPEFGPQPMAGVQGEVIGGLADQAGVFHLQELQRGRTAAPQSYVSTGGTGGANAQLPPLYARLGLAQPHELPSLVGQLVGNTAESSPRYELIQNILARMDDAGLLSQFGSAKRALQRVVYDWKAK